MANEKKQIKQCRVKADTCFKWHCLGKVFGLDLDDIGLMYMISQIQDDEGNVRYSLIEPELLEMFKETEAGWLALHNEKMKKNPLYRIAFADLNGQRKATTNHYKAEVERRAAYNARVNAENKKNDNSNENENNNENEEVVITSAETTKKCEHKKVQVGEQLMMIVYDDDMFVPTQEDIDNLTKVYEIDDIVKAIREGNKDEWRTDVQSYINID